MNRYRIPAERGPKGLASRLLHDMFEPGTSVNAPMPVGVPAGDKPIVLVSARVEITPMVSMLHALTDKANNRPVWFVHVARDGEHHALDEEIRALVQRNPKAKLHVAYNRPRPEDKSGSNYDSEGRIDGAMPSRLIGNIDTRFLPCGPVAFMAAIQSNIEVESVFTDHILTESFG